MAEYKDYSSLLKVSKVLTNERLSKALTDWFKEETTFTHWEYVSDTGKGDSYMSEVMRIRVYGTANGTSKHVQIILKRLPHSVSRVRTFRCDELFKNEIQFYEIVLPALIKFQSTKQVTEPFVEYPKLFLSYSDGQNDVICLEDATLDGYTTFAARQKGIDLEHCKVSIKSMAQFHAMSFAMRDQKPQEFDKLKTVIFEVYYHERIWGWYERFWKRLCGIAIDAVEKEYPNSIYVEKIKKFAVPEIYKKMIKAAADDTNGVFSHGDSWTNNFLYKNIDGKVATAKMIDFQLTRCASPVLDLSFFIYACTSQDLRDEYDNILKYYYEVLSKQITEMGSDPKKVYSWDVFMREIKKYSFFGLAFSFESTPTIVLEADEAMDMTMEGDEIYNIDDIWQLQLIKTKEGRLRECNGIVHSVDRGYI